MPPFRTRADALAPDLAPSAEVRDAVAQMVGQFADPLAFYRELVQNSIDAGARAVDVRLTFDPPETTTAAAGSDGSDGDPFAANGTLRVVVTDDGAGMDRATLEGCLLVLFRSTKDGDPTKIGKFGVGFFSVFAVRPERVLVDTARAGAPRGHRIALAPDFTYELADAPPRTGTAITVRVPIAAAAAADFAARSRAALARWCPHVAVALTFASTGVPGVADFAERIDRPLDALDPGAHAAVLHEDPDGARYALWVAHGGGRASYYNRGILLLGPAESPVVGVSVRVDCPALRHTLSRDDVRRDAAFERVQARATELARTALRAAVIAAIAQHATAIGRARAAQKPAPDEARAAFGELAAAALELRITEIAWPLAHPRPAQPPVHSARMDGGFALRARRLYINDERDAPLAEALARRGELVVDLSGAAVGADPAPLALFRRLYGNDAARAGELYGAPRVLADAALAEPAARALLVAVRALLATAGLPAVALADPIGAGSSRLYLALPSKMIEAPDAAALIDVDDAQAAPFALLGNRGIALNRGHARVRAALAAAAHDAGLAALLLARLVLLAAGRLDAARDAALFACAVGRAGSEARA